MLFQCAATILATAAVFATASPITDLSDIAPRQWGDEEDLMALVEEHMYEHADTGLPMDQMEVDKVSSDNSLEWTVCDLFDTGMPSSDTEIPTSTAVIPSATIETPGPTTTAPPEYCTLRDLISGVWKGPFPWTQDDSCGYKTLPGVPIAPLYDDCTSAIAKWEDQLYRGVRRQTQVFGTCVVAWEPVGTGASWVVSVDGSIIRQRTLAVIDWCRDGDMVSQYAHQTPPDGIGTFSVYKTGYPADGWHEYNLQVGKNVADDWWTKAFLG